MNTKPVNIRDAAELSESAWALVDEAIRSGQMTLETGTKITLESNEFVGLVKWLSTVKVKKPKFLATPEDYVPAVTGDIDEKEDEA